MTKLTEYDYKYLKGDSKFWEVRGAAFNVVYDFCRGCGYGEFGEPTGRGLLAMKRYEDEVDWPVEMCGG